MPEGDTTSTVANGHGVAQDCEKAVAWYTKAAEQGHAQAQYDLGMMYVKGAGLPQDLVKGYAWLKLVARSGEERSSGENSQVDRRQDDICPARGGNNACVRDG